MYGISVSDGIGLGGYNWVITVNGWPLQLGQWPFQNPACDRTKILNMSQEMDIMKILSSDKGISAV